MCTGLLKKKSGENSDELNSRPVGTKDKRPESPGSRVPEQVALAQQQKREQEGAIPGAAPGVGHAAPVA